ncbi:7-methylguanosine phosphate-specific 5'-nucleotidase isoform X1 [Condylostylus longicornis]|uniref:7-methylguanosine phosphate-specific 5'-nucleotidase isoform X1 n=1 Tax=Condylostylus longicornis TaxID=2530218 RepID=UPI00244DBE23|nr:7-methylguanosine phosphate-specific 5'-nucleotidase isoform X1 [Condylostylus longicornis]XP_055383457.1 7-methylguanosine phosphate-specific 5'-nucleotidase isoform X1 [Condylostylus longicornis]XP_055383458.1 7-methylguanosine phosphate-specific 5'-nucleotidase isoform X1 [Condylostylus longicornis]
MHRNVAKAKACLFFEKVAIFRQDRIKFKDINELIRKATGILESGPERLQFITDFDHTITKKHQSNGDKVPTSFGIFNKCKSLPSSYLDNYNELDVKYRKYEHSPDITLDEKIKLMKEWWQLSGEIVSGFPLDEKEIDEVASNYKDCLRDHSLELFETLNRLNVPVLVFSAGLGNSVVSVLKQANVMFPNMKVVSNFLEYKDGLLNGLSKPMIHAFNKNETAIEGTEYYDLVHSRDHIIVMGDSLGDAGMANGMPSSSIIIKIGFLYDHVEENLERYMEAFDIVLIDDQTMDIPLAILKLMEDK